MILFKVGNSESGDLLTIRLDSRDFSVTKMKESLEIFSGISASDQIILAGPPFKRLEAVFNENMYFENSKKIFIYDRNTFSNSTYQMRTIQLKPLLIGDMDKSTLSSSILSSAFRDSQSPLLKAIPDYERGFHLQIKKGEMYFNACEECYKSCSRCLDQMNVQIESIQAAMSNLKDHYHTTKSAFEPALNRLQFQQMSHQTLLDSFDDGISQLANIDLHPSLQRILNYTTSYEMPSPLRNLRDTIPLAKEKAWAEKCLQAHQKVEEYLSHITSVFTQVTDSITTATISMDALVDVAYLRSSILDAIATEISLQKDSIQHLRNTFHDISERIVIVVQNHICPSYTIDDHDHDHAAEGEQEQEEIINDNISNLLKDLEAARLQQEESLNTIGRRCDNVMSLKDQVALHRNELERNRWKIMRDIASIQTEIQFRLKKGLDLMRKWREGHNDYFEHLESVILLPQTYQHFLREIIVRKKYIEEFEMMVSKAIDDITARRNEEILRREIFMNDVGKRLPPIFFDIVTSLASKPQYFTGSLTERELLPDIGAMDISDDFDVNAVHSHIGNITVKKLTEQGNLDDEIYELSLETQSRINLLEFQNKELLLELNALRAQLAGVKSNAEETTYLTKADVSCCDRPKVMDAQTNEVTEDKSKMFDAINSLTDILREIRVELGIENTSQTLVMKAADNQIDIVDKLLEAQNALDNLLQDLNCRSKKDNKIDEIAKISFLKFGHNDIALFLPTKTPDLYRAFDHAKCPNRYLAKESLQQFKSGDRNPGYILGKILLVEKITETNRNEYHGIPFESNPSSDYFILYVEKVSFRPIGSA